MSIQPGTPDFPRQCEAPAFPTLDTADPALRPGLTKREYAAILLRVPDSGDPDIDAMIRTARRQEIASAQMQGLLASDQNGMWHAFAEGAANGADALIAELEKRG